MDQPVLVYALTALAISIPCFYIALILLSPPPIITRPSEKKYRSHSAPNAPRALPSLSDAGSVDLSVIIPAYNETARMPSMLATTIAHLTTPALKNSRTHELLVVDDGSADGTSDLALKLAKEHPESEIRVITLEKNLGKGGAVRHGMLHARGHRLLMVDADGASRFEDLELLWKAMDGVAPKNEPAVVVGSRAHLVKTEAVVKRSVIRNILMYGLHTILRIVGVGHIRDTQCGFKLFTRRAAQQIFPAQHLATWIFDVELLLLAKQLGIPVEEVPVEWHEVAGSKLNVVKDSLQMLRDLLVLRANQMTGRWKVDVGSIPKM
ncbi:glycosyltransferase family 2 protein [Leucogyrophana mollusca]|uniref:Glycosyltransferase family 2 protein n=1 Tax=Leucogyrophana mollusca TaxID=85980 RepID=A0ACB8BBE6_9AGAM|nr:glycosyltransferase family 2 protein [Leucogyrophana mollusca]